eukprot:TRINITY_DN1156_c0_g1_i1.p1 TRINITY_DN1156_c0_g1~~TRINITY_DN1156_c0_g1_i1.p1  ORF type:complete len:569 (+),score=250.40 TRINITY_DN1156_c0_g1_i1:79-1707(+)
MSSSSGEEDDVSVQSSDEEETGPDPEDFAAGQKAPVEEQQKQEEEQQQEDNQKDEEGKEPVESETSPAPAAAPVVDPSKSAPRKRYKEDFDWGKVIGEGAYGEVKLATDKETGVTYAIKVLNKKHIIAQKKVEWVNREKVLLDRLRHPNIVNLYFTFSDPESLHFVLEYCPHGELLDYIRKNTCFSLEVARFYTAEIVSALEFMHDNGVAHRDLKPENMLIGDNNHLKIVDFGTAKEFKSRSDRSKSFVGTAEYVCPELLINKEAGLSGDLWSLGCTLYQFVTGKMPFRAANDYLTFQLVMNRTLVFPDPIPPVARDLIDQLLTVDPEQRIGNREGGYKELKSHPFFEGIEWENLSLQTPPPFSPPDVLPVFPDSKGPSSSSSSSSPLAPSSPSLSPPDSEDLPSSSPSSSSPLSSSVDNSSSSSSPSTDRLSKLEEQKSSKWAKFLREGELLVQTSQIVKKRGVSKKKRQLILTDTPRLIYVDPSKMIERGEIPWSPQLKADAKDSSQFVVSVPGRNYKLSDPSGTAKQWVDSINSLRDSN